MIQETSAIYLQQASIEETVYEKISALEMQSALVMAQRCKKLRTAFLEIPTRKDFDSLFDQAWPKCDKVYFEFHNNGQIAKSLICLLRFDFWTKFASNKQDAIWYSTNFGKMYQSYRDAWIKNTRCLSAKRKELGHSRAQASARAGCRSH